MKKKTEKKPSEKKPLALEITYGGVYIKIPDDSNAVNVAVKLKDILDVFIQERNPAEVPEPEEKEEPVEVQKPEEKKEIDYSNLKLEDLKRCPVCNGKIKRKKIRQEGDRLVQTVKCKKWKCNFKHDFILPFK